MQKKFFKILSVILTAAIFSLSSASFAATYDIDVKGAHASINFKISHLGYSWLQGRFDKFDGSFSYDAKNPAASEISVTIDTASVNTNHTARDKHIRSDDFLDVATYPTANFVASNIVLDGEGKGTLNGELTLHGVTKPIAISVEKIGEGKDPWGGYRVGFTGSTSFKLKDYGITTNLGPASEEVYLTLEIEGIRR